MGFLIRSAFWLSLVLLLIPVGNAEDQVDTVGPLQAFFAAREAVGDIASMCDRKPAVCETGRQAVDTISYRAREGARMAYDMLEEDEPAARNDTITTGTVQAAN